YGGLLVAAFVIAEGASWGPDPLFKGKTLWFVRLSLSLGILFTFSRSAWVALGLSLMLLSLLRARIVVRLVVSAAIRSPFLLLLMGSHFLPVFETMASRPKQVQERFDLIEVALQTFVRHPFLGGGLGSVRLAAGEIAHNTAMWFLGDFGLAGLAVLLVFSAGSS